MEEGKRPWVTDECPPAYRALMEACWSGDAGARPAFTAVVEVLSRLVEECGGGVRRMWIVGVTQFR